MKHGIGGGGVFVQHIDTSSGTVTSVTVKQSTGHALLDRCAVEALRRWRYKTPTKVKTALIPITFVPERLHAKK
jgi:TonB family protein